MGANLFVPEAEDFCGCFQAETCFWKQKRVKFLPHAEKVRKNVPVYYSPVWSLICRLWFKLSIKSPWGPEPTCSPYSFLQTSTKDNGKRIAPGVPWGPNLAFSFLFFNPIFPFTFPAPLSLPLLLFGLFFFLPLNISLLPITHCKGSFCTALMERLLSNKDGSHCGTGTTNRIFCGHSEGALSSPTHTETGKKEDEWKKASLSQIYPLQNLELSKES